MKLNRFILAAVFFAAVLVSCEKDDEGGTEIIPPRDRGEQEIADQEALEEYLATHFYNYEEFENPAPGFDFMVRLDTISGANADKIPLIESDKLTKKTLKRNEVEYTLYILEAREGAGQQPTFADSTFVTYQGHLLDDSVFDGTSIPVWFDLVSVIPGFSHSLSELKGASGFTVNPDNTVTWEDYGVGTVFMPSGLGYFSNADRGIPAYSPLIFNLQLFSVNEADHDKDGIPSYLEDLDGDGDVSNDDTDGDKLANFADADDDGDFTPTREEIEIAEDGSLTFPDTNGNNVPDYLDAEVW